MSDSLTDREIALRALSGVTRDNKTGCLISSKLDRKGRATVRYQAHGHTKRELAHRAIYRVLYRPLAANEELRRTCRDTRCVEPAHFALSTV